MNYTELAPTYVRAIAPYQPGKPISEVARELGLAEKDIIKLASNENPLGCSPKAKAAMVKAIEEAHLYPDGSAYELKAALAKKWNVTMESIVIGHGSNDLLDYIAMAYLAPGVSAVYAQHCFAVYPITVLARGAARRASRCRRKILGMILTRCCRQSALIRACCSWPTRTIRLAPSRLTTRFTPS